MADLLEELAKATNPVAEASPEAPENQTVNTVDPEDFNEPEREPETKQAPDKGALLKSARRIVKAFSSLVKMGAKSLYAKTVLKPGDVQAMGQVRQLIDLNPETPQETVIEQAVRENEGFYGVFKRFEEYEKLIKDAPLTDEEQETIAEPLAEVIEKHTALHVGPEGALLLAVIIVMLPRLEPLFPSVTKMFTHVAKD